VERIEVNVVTGKRDTLQLTSQEVADANTKKALLPAPLTTQEALDVKLSEDPIWQAYVRSEAKRRGITPRQVMDAIISEA